MKLRFWLSLSAALLMTFAVFPTMAQSAFAANEDSLSYSSDGQNYSAQPPVLFAHTAVLVPGDIFTQSFWVKNNRAHSINIEVKPRKSVASSAVKIAPVNTAKSQLNAGEATKIEVQLWLPIGSAKDTQDLAEKKLGVVVNASEILGLDENEAPTAPPLDKPEDYLPDVLGNTGFNGYFLPLAIGMTLVGSLIYLASKRQDKRTKSFEGELP